MSMESESNGPSAHAVSLARVWLIIGGVFWLGLTVATLVSTDGSNLALISVLAMLALLHFIVALFGSRRVAVFFAILGP
jgi:hypothetical protein